MNQTIRRPPGTRDYLLDSAEEVQVVADMCRKSFARWGARPVITSTFDSVALATHPARGEADHSFRWVDDHDGQLVALRTDLTPQLAYLAATQLGRGALPLRIYCVERVFRDAPEYTGEPRELLQADVECFGEPTDKSKRDLLRLAMDLVGELGLRSASFILGHATMADAWADAFDVPKAKRPQWRQAMYTRSEHKLKKLAGPKFAKNSRLLATTVIPASSIASRLKTMPGQVAEAAQPLLAIVRGLKWKSDASLHVDLAAVPPNNYYDGMFFQAITPDLAAPIIGGGRYDRLVAEFGLQTGGMGFSVYVDRIVEQRRRDAAQKLARR